MSKKLFLPSRSLLSTGGGVKETVPKLRGHTLYHGSQHASRVPDQFGRQSGNSSNPGSVTVSQRRISREKSGSSLESSAGLGGMSIRQWALQEQGRLKKVRERNELPHASHLGQSAAPFLPSEKIGTIQACCEVRAHENAWHMVGIHCVLICFLPWKEDLQGKFLRLLISPERVIYSWG